MLRRAVLLAAAAALGAVLAPLATPRQSVTTIRAVVGPSETIYMLDAYGELLNRLDPGEYTIIVEDRSPEHNFHLSGPGVNELTDVTFVGTVTWNVTLTEGVYRFVCDPHAASMRGTLTVGNPPATTTATSPAPVPRPGPRLVATVGPGPTIFLTRNGARVRALRAGRYRVTVRDRSRFHNFHLRGPGVNRRTTVRFVGTITWTVTLKRGRYTFVCDPHARRMRGTVGVR